MCYDEGEEDTFLLSCCLKPVHLECLEQWKKTKKNKGEDPFCPHCRKPFEGEFIQDAYADGVDNVCPGKTEITCEKMFIIMIPCNYFVLTNIMML